MHTHARARARATHTHTYCNKETKSYNPSNNELLMTRETQILKNL